MKDAVKVLLTVQVSKRHESQGNNVCRSRQAGRRKQKEREMRKMSLFVYTISSLLLLLPSIIEVAKGFLTSSHMSSRCTFHALEIKRN